MALALPRRVPLSCMLHGLRCVACAIRAAPSSADPSATGTQTHGRDMRDMHSSAAVKWLP